MRAGKTLVLLKKSQEDSGSSETISVKLRFEIFPLLRSRKSMREWSRFGAGCWAMRD